MNERNFSLMQETIENPLGRDAGNLSLRAGISAKTPCNGCGSLTAQSSGKCKDPIDRRRIKFIEATTLTGPEIRARRIALGMSQTDMGNRTGLSRHIISYWEHKPGNHNLSKGTPAKMRKALRVKLPKPQPIEWDEATERQIAKLFPWYRPRPSIKRVVCGAKTRSANGSPCRNLSEPGKRRCKYHGGRSTGPRTPEGKARLSAAMRERRRVELGRPKSHV